MGGPLSVPLPHGTWAISTLVQFGVWWTYAVMRTLGHTESMEGRLPGFTIDARQTALLADITAACSVASEDALPWEVLVQVQRLLHADCHRIRRV